MRGFAIPLGDLLGEGETGAGATSRPIHEAAIATLTEISQRYAAPCPFKAGDIITPRKGYGIRNEGYPHVVLEVFAEPTEMHNVATVGDRAKPVAADRLDIRTATFYDEDVVSHLSESWQFELYVAPAE